MISVMRRCLTAAAALAAGAALAGGGSMTCTGQHVTTQADVDKGDLENAAVVTGRWPAGRPVLDADTEAVPAEHTPHIDLVKSAFPAEYDTAGQKITYTYTVTNTGNVTLHNVTLVDDRLGHVTCLADTLSPGESTTCVGLYFVTQADVDAGHITNVAVDSGDPPAGSRVTGGDTETIVAVHMPAIQLRKTAFPTRYAVAGERITYTYTVVNTGNVTLHGVTLTDNRFGRVSCPDTALAPGQSMTCTAVKVTTPADVANGQILNVATASGRAPDGTLVSGKAEAIVFAVALPIIPVTG